MKIFLSATLVACGAIISAIIMLVMLYHYIQKEPLKTREHHWVDCMENYTKSESPGMYAQACFHYAMDKCNQLGCLGMEENGNK